MGTITATTQRNLDIGYLEMAAKQFEKNNTGEGQLVFLAICREPRHDEHAVYRRMAQLQGLSSDDVAAGKLYFFDLEGKSSPAAQKAEAIRTHIRSLNIQENHLIKVSTEEIRQATDEDSWSGYKKAGLIGLGIVSAGLVIGAAGGIYYYQQRLRKESSPQFISSSNSGLTPLPQEGEKILEENGLQQTISPAESKQTPAEDALKKPIKYKNFFPEPAKPIKNKKKGGFNAVVNVAVPIGGKPGFSAQVKAFNKNGNTVTGAFNKGTLTLGFGTS